MAAKDMRLDDIDVDDRSPMETLPYWARATNPIVRRHLGLYWRTLPPEFEPILYITGFWVAALLAGIPLPFITDLATTVIVVSYRGLIYHPGTHTPMPNKSETYRVEGMNAELRHYLARLWRRSRCFSRCAEALRRSVKLFVYAWNRRQRYRQQYPGYTAHLKDFAYP